VLAGAEVRVDGLLMHKQFRVFAKLELQIKEFSISVMANQKGKKERIRSLGSIYNGMWPRRHRGRRGERRHVAQPAGHRVEAPPPHQDRRAPTAAARGGRRERPPHQLPVPLPRGHARRGPGSGAPAVPLPPRHRRRQPRAGAPPVALGSSRRRRGARWSARPRRPGPGSCHRARHRPDDGPRQPAARHAGVLKPPLSSGRHRRRS
jgi:hypothetical protein